MCVSVALNIYAFTHIYIYIGTDSCSFVAHVMGILYM